MHRSYSGTDWDDQPTAPFPGFGLVLGLLVFLLVAGLIGWSTQPPAAMYSHRCQRYNMDDDDDEDEWGEEYFQPRTDGKTGQLKTNAPLTSRAKNVLTQVTDKKKALKAAKPAPKVSTTLPVKQKKPEGFNKDEQDKKKVKFTEIKPVTVHKL